MEQETGEVDEEFGQRKMEHFKDRCRQILTTGDHFGGHDDIAYEGESIDIVTAYK